MSYARQTVTSRRLLVCLAPMGTLAAHGLAYWTQGGGGDLHHYLGLLGLPVVASVALVWVVAAPRARRVPLPSVRELVAAQLAVFVAQETIERAANHLSIGAVVSQLAGSDAVRAGLVLQVMVAIALLAAVRAGRVVVGRVVDGPWVRPAVRWRIAPPPVAVALPGSRVAGRLEVRTADGRGPPVVFVP